MDLRILGPLTIEHDGMPVRISAAKEKALLVRLLLADGRPVSVDALAEDLWDGSPPESAENALRVYVSKLRSALEAVTGDKMIETVPPGYRLELGPKGDVDARRFASVLAEGRGAVARGAHAQAGALYGEALSLWRGDALSDVTALLFVRTEAARLDELRLIATEEKAEADLAAGAHRQVADELGAMCRSHPTREALWGTWMLGLYRAGRQSEALDAYRELREHLADELGIDPSPEIARLHESILRQSPDLDPPGVLDAGSHNLPFPADRFIGRDADLKQLQELLREARLVTLTGPGGTGKTRLALETAHTLVRAPRDGVYLVDLASINDRSQVIGRIASAVGVREQPGRALNETLIDHLATREMLLLIDNCEHVIEEAAKTCDRILAASPAVRVLATSREPLHVPGETLYAVSPLEVPAANVRTLDQILAHASAALFVERARAADLRVEPSERDAAALGEICRRLDGIPLALELVAARTRTMSIPEIAANLTDALRLLTGGARTADPRHRTMRATVEWSYELLDPRERRLFARLSVFPGGCTVESAARVCSGDDLDAGEMRDLLHALADRSLLTVRQTLTRTRFAMLVVIRQYAAESLRASGDERRVMAARSAWALDLAERAASADNPTGTDADLQSELDVESDNVMASIEHAIADERTAEEAARLVIAAWPYLKSRERLEECRRYLEAVTTRPLPPILYGRALCQLAEVARLMGDLDGSKRHAEEALVIGRVHQDEHLEVDALVQLGTITYWLGMLSSSAETLGIALVIAERLGDSRAVGRTLNALALVVEAQGVTPRSRELRERSLTMARATGDREMEMLALGALGSSAFLKGRLAEAVDLWTASLTIARERGDRWRATTMGRYIGSALLRCGDLREARGLLEASLRVTTRSGDQAGSSEAFRGLGEAMYRTGHYEEALARQQRAVQIGAGANLVATADSLYELAIYEIATGNRANAADSVVEAAALSERAEYPLGRLWAVVLLGAIALADGDFVTARQRSSEALELGEEDGETAALAQAFRSLAMIATATGDVAEARAQSVRGMEVVLACEDGFEVARALATLGVAAAEPAAGSAVIALAASQAILTRGEMVLPPSERAQHAKACAKVRKCLGDAGFDAGWARGSELGPADAFAEALAAWPPVA